MLNLLYTTLLPFLVVLPFASTTPTAKECERPYYQFKNNVPDVYMVNFTEGYTLEKHYATVGQKFNATKLRTGYFANLTAELLTKVRGDCGVQFVEDDAFGEFEVDLDDSVSTSHLLARRGTQQSAPWPLYQLSASQKDPSDQTHYYLDNVGQGFDVYIMDTGINHPQDEFNDDNGNDRVIDLINFSTDTDFADSRPKGHGNSVASAAAGRRYGIAKFANILNVKFSTNGVPDDANFVRALDEITDRHNNRKTGTSFKGSVVNMSFRLTKSPLTIGALDRAAAAGISLVSSAGNDKYDPSDRYPSKNSNVIPVGASSKDYTPASFSNYGRGQVALWAPGDKVPLCAKDGKEILKTGTSYAAPYVAGILAIFYGVEGKNMDPTLARTRLMDQTDDWITLPNNGGQDWHNSPTAFANTGNRKGAAKNPPVKYIGGPDVVAASPTHKSGPKPTQGCQSPDHHNVVSFTLNEGNTALGDFPTQCQGVELKPGGPHGCILYYDPCGKGNDDDSNVNIAMTVDQTEWKSGVTSTWPDTQEMVDAIVGIMNSCDTSSTSKKWGGYKSVSVDAGMRMYNVSASVGGKYPDPAGFHVAKFTKCG